MHCIIYVYLYVLEISWIIFLTFLKLEELYCDYAKIKRISSKYKIAYCKVSDYINDKMMYIKFATDADN